MAVAGYFPRDEEADEGEYAHRHHSCVVTDHPVVNKEERDETPRERSDERRDAFSKRVVAKAFVYASRGNEVGHDGARHGPGSAE